jgi:hypothetical protein
MDEQTEFSWAPLGEQWWRTAAESCTHKPSEKQLRFAVGRHDGLLANDAARRAGYPGDREALRHAGSRAAKSTAVQELLAYAFAETGTGDDGLVKDGEAKRILSRIARTGDNTARIKSLESLAKLERDERAANKQEDSGDPADTARALIISIPYAGPAMAAGMWADAYGIETFPFLREIAPLLASKFPDDWARWRGRRPDPELDALAAGPVLSPDELVAALKKSDAPRVNGAARRGPFQEAETEQEAAADAA